MSNWLCRAARRTLWILVLLLLLGVVAWTVGNVIGGARYEGALRSLEEAGYPISLSFLAPAQPPAGEDAAPFYSAALALQVKPPDDTDSGMVWTPDPPGRVAEMTPEQRAKLKAWLAANQEAFDMVARARKRPRCRYEHDFAQGFSMPLPEVSRILELSRALQARAALQSLDGDVAGAQDSVRSILALSETLREEPVLVEQLVRLVSLRLAMKAIDACISSKTSDDDLRSWAELLPKEGFLDGALNLALRGEIGMLGDLFAGVQGDKWGEVLGLGGRLPWWLLRPLIRNDGSRYLAIMRQAADASRKPYAAARAELDRIEGIHVQGWTLSRPLCSLLLPALDRSLDSVTAAQAHVAVIRAGIDAERACLKSGMYPETVAATDPFTGKPLAVDPAGSKISSAGPEAKLAPNEPIEWILRAKK